MFLKWVQKKGNTWGFPAIAPKRISLRHQHAAGDVDVAVDVNVNGNGADVSCEMDFSLRGDPRLVFLFPVYTQHDGTTMGTGGGDRPLFTAGCQALRPQRFIRLTEAEVIDVEVVEVESSDPPRED